ncbi:MAG: hypothetical protein ACJ04Q_03365 [Flavobacteriales bacterium]
MKNQDKNYVQEQAFHKALKNFGYVFPETDKELDAFVESIGKMKFDIPSHLDNPTTILESGRIMKVGDFNSFIDNELEENLAQAAREGSEIPDDIREQMDNDRENAKDSDDEDISK